MALWLVRAGSYGEHEKEFLEKNRVYLTWEGLGTYDLSKVSTQDQLKDILREAYADYKEATLRNYGGQIWGFVKGIKIGDWVVCPLKNKPVIAIGEVKSDFNYDAKATSPYWFSREVKWINKEIPRSNFDQDLLYSFGAFMTVCRIERNDAENRVRQMAQNNWKTCLKSSISASSDSNITNEETIDLERLARDQIAKLIIHRFKGHGLARLIDAILKAQGYTTFLSPAGTDKGVDILAATGTLGFGHPRICVQVKSQDSPVDRPTLDQLIGTMQNFHADQGLLVSWGGFKTSVEKETASQFFRVRLWNQDNIIEALLENYDKLDEDLKAEIPLKRIWTVTAQDEKE
jgi:restriction system protein